MTRKTICLVLVLGLCLLVICLFPLRWVQDRKTDPGPPQTGRTPASSHDVSGNVSSPASAAAGGASPAGLNVNRMAFPDGHTVNATPGSIVDELGTSIRGLQYFTSGVKLAMLVGDVDNSRPAGQEAHIPEGAEIVYRHNERLSKLRGLDLCGDSVWVGRSKQPWQARIQLDRDRHTARVLVENPERNVREECEVGDGGSLVSVTKQGICLTEVNAFHLLMFRQYDPSQFHTLVDDQLVRTDSGGREVGIPVRLAESSDGTRLRFDAKTGNLLQAEVHLPDGVITADFDDFVPMDEQGELLLPMLSRISVPRPFFEKGRVLRDYPEFQRVIELRIDRKKSSIR